jgi:predicted PurR-regulated permease PerM
LLKNILIRIIALYCIKVKYNQGKSSAILKPMKDTFLSKTFMILIIFVIVIATLIIGKQIAIPFTLAVFLSLGLSPLVEWFQRKKFPRIFGIVLSFLISLGMITIIAAIIGFAVNDFTSQFPTYYEQIAANVENVKYTLMNTFSIGENQLKGYASNLNISSFGVNAVSTVVSATTNILGTLGLTLVMTFLLLLYRDRIKTFFSLIANEHRLQSIQTIVRKSFQVLPKYLRGIMIVIIIMTFLNTFGFWIIGVPSPLFWGIMVSLLNVIPYVGTIIGFGAVTLFTFIVIGPSAALLAIIMFLLVQFIDNNFLTPLIAGGQIDINPLAAIISIIIWGMIWGVLGMVLALPILGLIKIVCDSVDELQPYGYLLGNKT